MPLSSVTLLLPLLATHTLVPSKATADGEFPTAKLPTSAPVDATNSVTLLLPLIAIQIFVPSNAIPVGFSPTLNCPMLDPSLIRNRVIVVELLAPVTQTQEPSNAIPLG